tara:strand:+ start:4578 stop:5639 length:1062 start_codon:yes stop_codon:yes gene_type:complete
VATYFRLLDFARQFSDSAGAPLAGGKLHTYEGGTTTNKATYKDAAGVTAHANPIILNSVGRVESGAAAEVWGTTGSYKFKLTDSDDVVIPTSGDSIVGINDIAAEAGSEWIASGLTPTYVGATSWTFAGDRTAIFHVGRRVRIVDAGGTSYATVTVTSYSDPNTTVTVVNDATVIDSGISAVSYGATSKDNTSYAGGTLGTAVATTSGRAATFSGLPGWVTKIEIGLVGVSLDGNTDVMKVQLGDAGGFETTGYLMGLSNESGGSSANSTNGFNLNVNKAGAAIWHGIVTLTLVDASTFTWACSSQIARSDTSGGVNQGSGSKSLSATLTGVRVQLGGSTDDFDAGKINIRYS